ncbi:MAG: amino acid ABC transporter permease [Campylobacteraceae bacterium]
MDFDFIIRSIPRYIDAAFVTLYLSFCGIIISIIVGFLCSLIIYFKVKILSTIVNIYIELSRNTPLLIQIALLHFGLKFEATTSAIIGLAFLGGSYMAEAFRSGLESVEKIQIESALSIGLTKFQLILYILLPQALVLSVPALGANIIFLIKESSVVYIVALADLVFLTKDIIGSVYKTNEALFLLVVAYLVILLPISFLITFIEKKVRFASFGN